MRDFIIRLEKNTSIEIYHEYICGAYDYPILNMLKKKSCSLKIVNLFQNEVWNAVLVSIYYLDM